MFKAFARPQKKLSTEKIRNLRILLAGVGRNFESGIPKLEAACTELDALLPNYEFLIYENNSEDSTTSRLADWCARNPRIKVHSDFFSEQEILAVTQTRDHKGRPCRIELISLARNRLMTLIEQERYADVDYVVLCDLDQTSPMPIAGIVDRLAYEHGTFDALICNGIDERRRLYDLYAYRDFKYPFGPEVLGGRFWSRLNQWRVRTRVKYQRKNIPLISGFNGLSIIRKAALEGLRYSPMPQPPLDRMYRKLGLPQKQRIESSRAARPAGDYLFGEDGVHYQHSNGCAHSIVCEHVHFFLSMRENGFDRIYLSPSLVWHWKRGVPTPSEKLVQIAQHLLARRK